MLIKPLLVTLFFLAVGSSGLASIYSICLSTCLKSRASRYSVPDEAYVVISVRSITISSSSEVASTLSVSVVLVAEELSAVPSLLSSTALSALLSAVSSSMLSAVPSSDV